MFDVCVVGHITKDIVKSADGEFQMPGGTAYYTAIALKNLGMSVAVITKINDQDTFLLRELEEEDIHVFLGESDWTTTFKNLYSDDTNTRVQWVKEVAKPFTVSDVSGCEARIFHLGPLTKYDIPLEVIQFLADRSTVSLDVQGLVRDFVKRGRGWTQVRHVVWEEKKEVLALVNIVKANEEEARILSTKWNLTEIAVELSNFGVEEVVITCGSNPSLIYSKGKSYWISSYSAQDLGTIDPTGCGDTYMAGYLFYREQTTKLDEVGKFAAMTATMKLEKGGPFRGSEEDVLDFANALGQPFLPKMT
ncbi:Ribokinase [Dissulfuribacter thermophilus]|uniref:Ribokinase n=2 Tax=Dissulfuribacter thermophilus TaxID=1156395 RepID=A0A1B9F8K2_9BACT|nr:Ribokinase [Dissulfuribacter thermophilus]